MSLSTLNADAKSDEIISSLIDQLTRVKEYLSDKDGDYEKNMATRIEMLRKDLSYIGRAFTGLKSFEESASDLFKILRQPQHTLDQLSDSPNQTHIRDWKPKKSQLDYELRVLSENIIKLKILIPSHSLPDLHFSKVFNDSPALKEFHVVYNSLDVIAKLCLLCFAAFPANEVIQKRALVHWWAGEGFLNPLVDERKTVEDIADGIFEELTKKGCIEPVKKKRRLVVRGFKMHPLIRSAVIKIAEEVGFFNFDNKGNPTAKFSHSYRACLVNGSSHLMEDIPLDLAKKLQTVFNVNESYPNFAKVDWSKLRNLKVLHLGRWHSKAKHHIEVDDIEYLRGLIHLKHLRIICLRGISRIMELPDSVCKLVALKILDLGACPNLELLPEAIGSLKNLTHLDMSECYLLEHMPKGISSLSELQVLKGFVIGSHDTSSCTLHELLALQKLRKLTINTSRVNFPTEEELSVLQQFGSLRKLMIAWGWSSSPAIPLDKPAAQPMTRSTLNSSGDNTIQYNTSPKPATPKALKNHMISRSPTFKRRTKPATMNQEHRMKLDLEKLDLQCYPHMTAPNWLRPGNFKGLKKLYIRGGKLRNLVRVQEEDNWGIEILRLKFLSELKMDWNEIPVSFPDLIYLEKFRCPKLTFFPCDESGVWIKPGN